MTTKTPDAVREAASVAAFHAIHGDGDPFANPETFDFASKVAGAVIAALDSCAGNDLTPRERIARVVAWEHFGIAWHHMEKQSHADVLAMVDRMLDSRAGDAGEGPQDCMWRSGHDGTGPDPSRFFCEVIGPAPSCHVYRAVADTENEARALAFRKADPAFVATIAGGAGDAGQYRRAGGCGAHSQAIEYALKLHDHPEQAHEFLVDWSQGSLARWPDFTEWLERMPLPDDGGFAMITRDCKRMRTVGMKLAEAALYTVREYDGVHRLALAVSEWTRAVADEGDRAATPAPAVDAVPAGEVETLSHAIKQAKRNLALTQGCMECNAADEQRWQDTIAWLESLA